MVRISSYCPRIVAPFLFLAYMSYIKVAVLIQENDTFLLVQEKDSRAHGLWNWPQGTLEEGEGLEDAAIREVKEETGLAIRIEKKIATLHCTFADTKELHVYKGSIIGGTIRFPDDEILDVRYFTLKQIEDMKDQLVGRWVYTLIIGEPLST